MVNVVICGRRGITVTTTEYYYLVLVRYWRFRKKEYLASIVSEL
jgi:hypothetical protein